MLVPMLVYWCSTMVPIKWSAKELAARYGSLEMLDKMEEIDFVELVSLTLTLHIFFFFYSVTSWRNLASSRLLPYGAFVFFCHCKAAVHVEFCELLMTCYGFCYGACLSEQMYPAKKFIFVCNLYGYSVMFYWCSLVHVVIPAMLLPRSFAVCDLPSFITAHDCGVPMLRRQANGNMLKGTQHMLYNINMRATKLTYQYCSYICLLFGGSVQVQCSFLC